MQEGREAACQLSMQHLLGQTCWRCLYAKVLLLEMFAKASFPIRAQHLGLHSRRLRGSLEGNPEPGDRLRFVFVFVSCVACVRAGEAKLRVRARCIVFLLGRPQLWEVLLRSSQPLREARDVVYTWVLKQNGSKSVARCSHYVCFTSVL